MNSDSDSPDKRPPSPTPEEEPFPDHLLEAYVLDCLSVERRRALDERIHHDPVLARRIEELRTECTRFRDALAAGRQDPPDSPLADETLGRFIDGSLSEEDREAVIHRLGGSIEQQQRLMALFHETQAVRGADAAPGPPQPVSPSDGREGPPLHLEKPGDRTKPFFAGIIARLLGLVAGVSVFVGASFVVDQRGRLPLLFAALGCVACLLGESSAIRLARAYPSLLPRNVPRQPWRWAHATVAAAALFAATIWPSSGLWWSMLAGLFFLAWLLDGLPQRVESYRSGLRNLRIHSAGQRLDTGEESQDDRRKEAGEI